MKENSLCLVVSWRTKENYEKELASIKPVAKTTPSRITQFGVTFYKLNKTKKD